ncbi:hypothetical protein niasHT_035233 [Heterodera trifolii]|uniref:HAT C-terminal dimerisation domain-containing protein n=1 Tax=Heterodera trifolii TaxID=157864 RepID=A0ABD2J3L8_9BILA
MDKKVINFVTATNTSFKAIDHPTFHSLLAPQQIKGESYYRKQILPDVYKQVRKKIKNELEECEWLSFTTDAWSGPTNNFLWLEKIANLLKQCRKVVSHFKHSNKALGMLQNIQSILELPEHSLLQEIPVRWNSALAMISRLLEQKDAIYQYAFENRSFDLTLTEEEWKLIEELIILLQPIEEASKMLMKSPLSAQIPIAVTLHSKLFNAKLINKEIDSARCSLVNEIEKYFFGLREKRVHCLSTFLDVRFKDKFLLERRNIFLAKILTWIREENAVFISPPITEIDEIDCVPPPIKKQRASLFDELNEIASSSNKENAVITNDIEDEFNKYLVAGCGDSRDDPVAAWRKMATKFPLLSKIARKYLSAPATSLPSEATFKYKSKKFGQFSSLKFIFISFPPLLPNDAAVETTDAEVSATAPIKRHSDNTIIYHQQQQRRMDQINFFCDTVWLDTLAWINRGEVGMKFALVNDRFNILVDKHFKQRKWCFGEFHICERLVGESGAEIMTSVDGPDFSTLPLPTTPLPDSVVGFRSISIWSPFTFQIDLKALEFSTHFMQSRSWKVIARYIWPLLRDGISTLCLKKRDLIRLLKNVSPTVLFDCAGLRRIHTDMMTKCPSADVAEEENVVVVDTTCSELYTWVHSPREEGHGPVSLRLIMWEEGKWDDFLNNLFKVSFNTATFPVNCMIFSLLPFSFSNSCQMENHQTQERLSMSSRVYQNGGGALLTKVTIVRFPMDFDDKQIGMWLRIAKVTEDVPSNLVHIAFNDNEIGELSSDLSSDSSE